MKNEIKRYILNNNLLFPRYNRNIARPAYWKNRNKDWCEYLFGLYKNAQKKYSNITFADFLRHYIMSSETKRKLIPIYSNVVDFMTNTTKTQINPGTEDYEKYWHDAKAFVNFEPINFTEIIYCFRQNIASRPACVYCGSDVTFIVMKHGFRKFCTQRCQLKHNNSHKTPKHSHLSHDEIIKVIETISPDNRNLTNEAIANVYLNIEKYTNTAPDISVAERIYLYANKQSTQDTMCECGEKKKFLSQVRGYTNTCGRNTCLNIHRHGDKYYKENAINTKRSRGGSKSVINGFIYLMYSEHYKLHKIGITTNPVTRLHKLQKFIPDLEFQVCTYKSNVYFLEQTLHKKYKHNNIKMKNVFDGYTEFFELSEFDERDIENIIMKG